MIYTLNYWLLRVLGLPFAFLPLPVIRGIGKQLGNLMFHLHRPFRKKALTNLAWAHTLNLSYKEQLDVCRKAFQNLAITTLEYFPLAQGREIPVELVGPMDEVRMLSRKGQGIVFLTAHQANWEIPFIHITKELPGVAIGRPIKNRAMYRWILSLREQNGGRIITRKNGVRLGLNALRKGNFLGIVGDQALPESRYTYPFFGTKAYTASTPAMLAYRTGSPLMVATTKRTKKGYTITGSPLIWPDKTKQMKREVHSMMNQAMQTLESSIAETPGEWLWQHDRWKQVHIDHIKRKYRYSFVLVTLPEDPTPFLPAIEQLRKLYPRSLFTFYVPKGTKLEQEDVIVYDSYEDLFRVDHRFQLLFDFYDDEKLRKFYRKLSVFQTLSSKELGNDPKVLPDQLVQLLVKPECRSTVSS